MFISNIKTQINFIVYVCIAINLNTLIKWFENKTKINILLQLKTKKQTNILLQLNY